MQIYKRVCIVFDITEDPRMSAEAQAAQIEIQAPEVEEEYHREDKRE